jgi:hypothetical protein
MTTLIQIPYGYEGRYELLSGKASAAEYLACQLVNLSTT